MFHDFFFHLLKKQQSSFVARLRLYYANLSSRLMKRIKSVLLEQLKVAFIACTDSTRKAYDIFALATISIVFRCVSCNHQLKYAALIDLNYCEHNYNRLEIKYNVCTCNIAYVFNVNNSFTFK
ncbi:ATP-dependent RNA helicase DDX19B [Trichinella spiralis]|uniref:ATP-dependent RNA helicase DDX19B n=1 Tax=Trichinella spiralis TaxID=6334 RepID=UPI0001EFC45A|nr:ATP-dependent RNA helicase DDX19B [Trichinella spiralis]